MRIESHATPSECSAQHRYASLHRAIERGLTSDELWLELGDVCAALGHHEEALRCAAQVSHDGKRRALEARLRRASGEHTHSAAPAAGDAGAHAFADQPQPSAMAHVADAFHYLLHQSMPWLVLSTVLAFPLLIGLGGALTRGSSLWLLTGLAALPGLCVLTVVFGMGRQILLASSEGDGDVPPLPEFGRLLGNARRFLADLVLVAATFFGPSAAAFAAGTPLLTLAPGVVLSALFAPLGFALRQVRGDLGALSPVTLVRAAARCGRGWFTISVATLLLAAPAAAVAFYCHDRAIWVQIAVLGPLAVTPIFVASRLLGSFLDTHREALGALLHCTNRAAAAAKSATSTNQSAGGPTADRPQPRALRRPDGRERLRVPTQRVAAAAAPRGTKAPPPVSAYTRRPVDAPKPKPAAPAPAAAGPGQRKIEGRRPQRLTDAPDLRHLPGAQVVSGTDRLGAGAAAPRPGAR